MPRRARRRRYVGAKEGTLSIMVGDDERGFQTIKPTTEVLGRTIDLCGLSGAGQKGEAYNQVQVALNLIGMAEVLVLG